MFGKKTPWQATATLPKVSTYIYGCKIQNLQIGAVPVLIQEKPIANLQSQTLNLKACWKQRALG